MIVLGDFEVGDPLYIPFDAYDSNGASVTITGFAVTDIEVYKNGSTTQRSSDNGYSLLDTDGTDFDGTVGLHGFSIDTNDNSDSGFWSAGAQYWINVNAVTIDGQTVRFTYYATLGRTLKPTVAGRKLDVSTGGEAGIDWANIGSPTTTVNLSGTTVGVVTSATLNTTQGALTFSSLTVSGKLLVSDGFEINAATTDRPAIKATGNGAGEAFRLIAGATGRAIYASAAAGHCFELSAAGNDKYALYGHSGITGNAVVFEANPNASAQTLVDRGHAFALYSSDTTNGNAILLRALFHGCALFGKAVDNEAAFHLQGGLTGPAMRLWPGINGLGIAGLEIVGPPNGPAISAIGGYTVHGGTPSQGCSAIQIINQSTQSGSAGVSINSYMGTALDITASGTGSKAVNIYSLYSHAVNIDTNGASSHGVTISGGNSGTSDGVRLNAGTGGVGLRLGSLTVTGNSTLTGAVSLGSTLGVTGTTTLAAVNATTVSFSGGLVANITGNLSGSVGSVAGNVGGNVVGSVASVAGNIGGNVVGSVGSVVGNVGGNVTGSVGSVLTIDEDTTTLDLDATIRAALGMAAANMDTQLDTLPTANENADALLDRANGIETGVTMRQAMRAVSSILAGIISGGGSGTEVFKAIAAAAGGTTRVTVTVDQDGNRSAVTLNL